MIYRYLVSGIKQISAIDLLPLSGCNLLYMEKKNENSMEVNVSDCKNQAKWEK